MTSYSDAARVRADVPPAGVMPRLTFGRRSLVDAPPVAAAEAGPPALEATEEFGSSFDVPAFLRRQEG
jgi:hypothetical protein